MSGLHFCYYTFVVFHACTDARNVSMKNYTAAIMIWQLIFEIHFLQNIITELLKDIVAWLIAKG
jgi:hypothetical protein